VAGTDINLTELSQAKRVFGHVENLEFFNGGISQETINGEEFDIIVFAASIQYFRSFEEIVSKALRLLEPTGEIHILDSFFYRSSELETARRRTAEYYESIQSPEMTKHYFHRCVDELKPYHHHIFYNPYSFTHRFTKNNSPFHWICIYHA